MSIFDKFKLGLSKSSKSISSGLNDLIFKKKIDENILNELEDFLIQSDVGVESAKELREKFSKTKVDSKSSEKKVDIEFQEGLLSIDWKKNNNIYMTGKVSEIKKITVNL